MRKPGEPEICVILAMASRPLNPAENDGKYRLVCPHCDKRIKVPIELISRLTPNLEQHEKCPGCKSSICFYIDNEEQLHSRPGTASPPDFEAVRSVVKERENAEADFAEKSVAAKASPSTEKTISTDDANRAFVTLVKLIRKNPKATVQLLVTPGSEFVSRFRKHLQDESFEKLDAANREVRQTFSNLYAGVNKGLDEIYAKLSGDINELKRRKAETEREVAEQLVAVHQYAHLELRLLLNHFEESSSETEVLIKQHLDLIKDYKAAREQTKQEISQRLIRELVDNEMLRNTLDEYFATHHNERREELIKRLPALFDAVESEANTWELRDDVDESTKAEVLRVLSKIQRRIDDWQNRCGINRIAPAPGDVYDNRQHQLVATKPAERADQAHTIESLEQSGYFVERNGQEKEFIRKARVVVWDEPQPLPSATEQAGQE